MTYRGHVQKGVIVPEEPLDLPDGAEVAIRPVRSRGKTRSATRQRSSTLHDRMKGFIGKAKGLPPDASVNVDHYLYGMPKK